eukprot:m.1212448 g.1212448  ORF g.1212448 m.1212448 type:complete len:336 (-) comp24598_c0_seq5:3280-4287(-)
MTSGGKNGDEAKDDDNSSMAPPSPAEDDAGAEELNESEDVTSSEEESSSEESSAEEDVAELKNVKRPKETLLQGRSKRATAGRRMASLLNDEEDDDDFYKEKYGDSVFHDSNSDFEESAEESWDELDSDFDQDEDQDSDNGAAVEPDEELKRKRNVYIDPLRPSKKQRKGRPPGFKGGRRAPVKTTAAGDGGVPRSTRAAAMPPPREPRKSTRSAAVERNKERASRNQSAKAKKRDRKPKTPPKKLTQAQRLREAVSTERENTQSLLRFEQKLAAKKKATLRKTTFAGPVVRLHSKTETTEDGLKQTRNYMVFTETDLFLGKPFPSCADVEITTS